jgi:hypothetical protein
MPFQSLNPRLLQKRHSVVKNIRICLTRRINLNSLSTQHALRWIDFGVRFSRSVLLAVAVVGVAGCAAVSQRSPEEAVAARAQERWDALVKGDLKTAYGYYSPGSRSVMDLASYESTVRRGFWKSAKVDKAVCAEAQSCDVHVTIEYEYRGGRTKTPLRETWIQDGSNWWLVQK